MGLSTRNFEHEHEVVSTIIIPFSVRQLLGMPALADCRGSLRKLFTHWRQRTILRPENTKLYPGYDIVQKEDPRLEELLKRLKADPGADHSDLFEQFYRSLDYKLRSNTQVFESIYCAKKEPLFRCLHHPDLESKWSLTSEILMRQLADVVEKSTHSNLRTETFDVNLSEQDVPQALERLWRLDPPILSQKERKTFDQTLEKQMLTLAVDVESIYSLGLSKLNLIRRSDGQTLDSLLEIRRALITVSPWGFGEVSLTFSITINQSEDFLTHINEVIYALTRSVGPINSSKREDSREPAEFILKSHDFIKNEKFRDLYLTYAELNNLPKMFYSNEGFTLWTLVHWLISLSDDSAGALTGGEGKPIKRSRKVFHLTSILPNRAWHESKPDMEEVHNKVILIGQGYKKPHDLPMFEKNTVHLFETITYLSKNGSVALNLRASDSESTWGISSFQRTQLLFTLHSMAERNALKRAIDEAHDMIWRLSETDKNMISDVQVDALSLLIENLIAIRLSFSTRSAGQEEHASRFKLLSKTFEVNELREEAENTIRELSALIDRYEQRRELKVERTISRVALVLSPAAVMTGLMGMNNFNATRIFEGDRASLSGFEWFFSYLSTGTVILLSIFISAALLWWVERRRPRKG